MCLVHFYIDKASDGWTQHFWTLRFINLHSSYWPSSIPLRFRHMLVLQSFTGFHVNCSPKLAKYMPPHFHSRYCIWLSALIHPSDVKLSYDRINDYPNCPIPLTSKIWNSISPFLFFPSCDMRAFKVRMSSQSNDLRAFCLAFPTVAFLALSKKNPENIDYRWPQRDEGREDLNRWDWWTMQRYILGTVITKDMCNSIMTMMKGRRRQRTRGRKRMKISKFPSETVRNSARKWRNETTESRGEERWGKGREIEVIVAVVVMWRTYALHECDFSVHLRAFGPWASVGETFITSRQRKCNILFITVSLVTHLAP